MVGVLVVVVVVAVVGRGTTEWWPRQHCCSDRARCHYRCMRASAHSLQCHAHSTTHWTAGRERRADGRCILLHTMFNHWRLCEHDQCAVCASGVNRVCRGMLGSAVICCWSARGVHVRYRPLQCVADRSRCCSVAAAVLLLFCARAVQCVGSSSRVGHIDCAAAAVLLLLHISAAVPLHWCPLCCCCCCVTTLCRPYDVYPSTTVDSAAVPLHHLHEIVNHLDVPLTITSPMFASLADRAPHSTPARSRRRQMCQR